MNDDAKMVISSLLVIFGFSDRTAETPLWRLALTNSVPDTRLSHSKRVWTSIIAGYSTSRNE